MNQALALGLLRHALQLGSGYAVAHGLWKDGGTETIVGAVLSLVTVARMWIDRRRTAKAATVARAVQEMAAATKRDRSSPGCSICNCPMRFRQASRIWPAAGVAHLLPKRRGSSPVRS